MISRTGVAALLAALTLAAGGCHSESPQGPTPSPSALPPEPIPLSPVGGTLVTTDTPTLTVQNARGFDGGQASYTFRVSTPASGRDLAIFALAAGLGTTSATVPNPLPRGMNLTWKATASGPAGEVSSAPASFRSAAVACQPNVSPYAKSIVDFFVPACSLRQNKFNDPEEVLGPPDAGGKGPDKFHGFVSLGDDGYVTVDMESCAEDRPGPDVRVFQSVSNEEVTLWAGGQPQGPFVLVRFKKACGAPSPGLFSGHCDFDLGEVGVAEARYFKIEDGENFPCPGFTVTEGADIDAIQILHAKP